MRPLLAGLLALALLGAGRADEPPPPTTPAPRADLEPLAGTWEVRVGDHKTGWGGMIRAEIELAPGGVAAGSVRYSFYVRRGVELEQAHRAPGPQFTAVRRGGALHLVVVDLPDSAAPTAPRGRQYVRAEVLKDRLTLAPGPGWGAMVQGTRLERVAIDWDRLRWNRTAKTDTPLGPPAAEPIPEPNPPPEK